MSGERPTDAERREWTMPGPRWFENVDNELGKLHVHVNDLRRDMPDALDLQARNEKVDHEFAAVRAENAVIIRKLDAVSEVVTAWAAMKMGGMFVRWLIGLIGAGLAAYLAWRGLQ